MVEFTWQTGEAEVPYCNINEGFTIADKVKDEDYLSFVDERICEYGDFHQMKQSDLEEEEKGQRSLQLKSVYFYKTGDFLVTVLKKEEGKKS